MIYYNYINIVYIREYDTLYVGMAWEKNGHLYILIIATNKLKSLLILYRVFMTNNIF